MALSFFKTLHGHDTSRLRGCFSSFLERKRISEVLGLRRFVFAVGCTCLLIAVSAASSSSLRNRVASAVSEQSLAADPAADMRFFMTVELAPRFLRAYPVFGQGPIPLADAVRPGETDTSLGPTLKAAPSLPGWVAFYLPDVVWLMILGLYGCAGLASCGFVFWSIAAAARKVARTENQTAGYHNPRPCVSGNDRAVHYFGILQ